MNFSNVIRSVALAMLLPMLGGQAWAQPLEGTTWRLVAIQSMDDAQGTTRIPEAHTITLNLGAGGQATMRLDCNQGMASYQVQPSEDGKTGGVVFGPVAATRALCPPPHWDERMTRDLAYVRGYRLNSGKLYLSLLADGGIYEWEPLQPAPPAVDTGRTVQAVKFARGQNARAVRGRIVGRQYIDHTVQARAGQRLRVELKGSNRSIYFNVLPPGSVDAAMARGELTDNRFDGLLPDDGVYTVRVYQVRAAGRRNQAAQFTLTLALQGTPLNAVPASTDATLDGTRYHASTTTTCKPAYVAARPCEAWVVRRGFDGTATVELRWDGAARRRILFIKGVPKAADVSGDMAYVRTERGWTITFEGDESFEIPEALVYGG